MLQISEKEIVRIQVLNSRRLYLSQLQPAGISEASAFAPSQQARMDKNCQGNAITIGAQTFPWGIGVHATSELNFKIRKAFKTFHAAFPAYILGTVSCDQPGRQLDESNSILVLRERSCPA